MIDIMKPEEMDRITNLRDQIIETILSFGETYRISKLAVTAAGEELENHFIPKEYPSQKLGLK